MDKRTAEIIMICKGRHDFGEELTHKQAIAAYMSDACGCPIEEYTNNILNDIIYQAALDYIDGLPKPSVFIRSIMDVLNLNNNPLISADQHLDYYEAVCRAFSLVRVKAKNEYGDEYFVNGFDLTLVHPVRKSSNDLM